MENETNDDIITSENNDEEETPVEYADESTENTHEEVKVEKPKETDEARKARLERQLTKVNRKLGIEPKETLQESQDLSSKDVIYLAKADIHEEDMDEVLNYAQKNETGVKEAHAYLQPILDKRGEERTTANATTTRSPRGTSKPDGSKLLADANRGKLPAEDDLEGIDALTSAHLASKQPSHTKK
tara:strand:+ start:299 stop:856 length:558 start_codon:yes stop_codon:yes gene_type:complete